MNLKTTIALLLMLAGVGSYVFFVELDRETTFDREQREAETIQLDGEALFPRDTRPDVTDIQRLELTLDKQTVVIERQDNGWQQIAPVTFPMQGFAVDRVIRELLEMRRFETLETSDTDTPTTAIARLDPPEATLTLTTADNQKIQARLGKRLPGDKAYLQRLDTTDAPDPTLPILVVDDDLHLAILDEGVNNWRTTTLSAPTPNQIDSLIITPAAEDPLTLFRQADRWSLDNNGIERTDQQAATSLIQALSRLRIDSFTADNPIDLTLYGLLRPRLVVSAIPKKTEDAVPATGSSENDPALPGPTHTPALNLLIGAPADMETTTRFAAIAQGDEPISVVFTLRDGDIEAFRQTADDLRDPRVLAITTTDIERITVDTDQQAYTLLRGDNGALSFDNPSPGYAPDTLVTDEALNNLAGLASNEFVPTSRTNQQLASLTVNVLGETEPIRLTIYTPTDLEEDTEPRLLVVRDPEPFAYMVPPDTLSDWLDGPLTLKERTLFSAARQDITQIEVRYPLRQTVELIRNPETNAWVVNGETSANPAIDRLLNELSILRADRWLSPEDTPAAQIEADQSRLTVWTGNASEPALQITLHAPSGTGHHTDNPAEPFTLTNSTLETLLAELRPTDLLTVSPAEVRSVTLTSQSQELTLQRDPAGTLTSADGAELLDPESAIRLIDELAQLRAERLLTERQTPDPDYGVRLRLTLQDSRQITLQLTDLAPRDLMLPSSDTAAVAIFNRRPVLVDQSLHDLAVQILTTESRIP
ncbi:DUF4340 domain-containing protein [Mucisphaera sp.]|uniref:DUF4340 domain-containing protein n=1 Tax=Mucisphaera sp. TaxID=2913024 RepID=UPI003D0C7D4B